MSGDARRPAVILPAALADALLPDLVPVDELMALNPELEAFIVRTVAYASTDRQRLINLEQTVSHPGGLGIAYDPQATLRVSEAFRTKRGNCLALSLLFVAMARSIDIDARFQEVEVEPYWRQQNGVVFSQRHINVVGDLRRERYVLDFYQAQPGQKLRPMRLMTDKEAFGQFYNNKAAEALAARDERRAFANFQRALNLAPEISWIWSNAAVLYRRLGEEDQAEKFLRHALYLDPSNTAAMATLGAILETRGASAEAARLKRKARSARERNPFYWFSEAEKLRAAGKADGALDALDKAIRRAPAEAVFYRLAIEVAVEARLSKRESEIRVLAQRRGIELN